MESKLLQLFDMVSERLDNYVIDSYKSIGVPYTSLRGGSRSQVIESIAKEHGLDYFVSPEHVFSRIINKYISVGDHGKNHFVSFSKHSINNFLHTNNEMIAGKYCFAPTIELQHKVLLENSKKNASFVTDLGCILRAIEPRLSANVDVFSDRMINLVRGESIEADGEEQFNIMSEIECLFENDIDRIKTYYRNCLRGIYDVLWITTPSRDTKIRNLFHAINEGIFGPDTELIDRSGYGNYLYSNTSNRHALAGIFGDVYGPVGNVIIQNRVHDQNIIDSARLAPCMFILPVAPEEDSCWVSLDRLDVEETVKYKMPRATQGKKFTIGEIKEFIAAIEND